MATWGECYVDRGAELARDFTALVDALEEWERQRRWRRARYAWWAVLEAWSWARWAWSRRPFWLWWGVAHETPLHDPEHYRRPEPFAVQMGRLAEHFVQLGEAWGRALQPVVERAFSAAEQIAQGIMRTQEGHQQ